MIDVVTGSKRRLATRPFIARALVSLSAVYLAVAIVLNANVDSYRLDLSRVGGLADVGAALSLAFLCGAVGWELLGRRVSAEAPFPLLGSCVVVGIGGLGTFLLVLGWFRLYHRWVIVASLVAFAAIAMRNAPGWLRTCSRSARRLRRFAKGPFGLVWLGVQVVGVGSLLLIALAPITDYDSLMYHLDLPIEFLGSGEVFVPVDNRHYSFISPLHFVYIIPVAAGLIHAVMVFSLVGFVLFLVTMVEIGQDLTGLRGAMVTGILVWVPTSFALTAVDAKVEVWVICLIALTVYWALRCEDCRESVWLSMSLGLSGGLALAAKLTAAPVVGGIMLAGAFLDYRRRGIFGRAILPMAVAALVWSPWLFKNLVAFGDPMFPFLTSLGPDPWLVDLGATSIPGVGILGSARDSFSLVTWIVNPGRLTLEGSGYLQGLPALIAVGWVIGLIVSARRRAAIALIVAIAAAHLLLVVGFRSNTNLRYLLPAMVLFVLASGVGLAAAARKSIWSGRLVIVLLGLSLIGTSSFLVDQLRDGHLVFLPSGASTESWLEDKGTGHLIALDHFLEDDDSDLAILLFEGRAAGFETPVLQDNVMTTWQAMTTLPLLECPSLGEATHLVVNELHLDYFSRRGVDLNEAHWNEFAPYAEKCLEVSGVVGPYRVYAIEEGM